MHTLRLKQVSARCKPSHALAASTSEHVHSRPTLYMKRARREEDDTEEDDEARWCECCEEALAGFGVCEPASAGEEGALCHA